MPFGSRAPRSRHTQPRRRRSGALPMPFAAICAARVSWRSEEHTTELKSLMRISYAVFCLKKKTHTADSIPYFRVQSMRQTTNINIHQHENQLLIVNRTM